MLQDLLKIVASPLHENIISPTGNSTMSPNMTYSPFLSESMQLGLPTIRIECFDGSYTKWSEFGDMFEENVNKHPALNNALKLKYLKNHLKGDVLKMIKKDHGTLSAENYKNIWKSLNDLYNNKRFLINSYFHLLFYQQVIEHESYEQIKQLYMTTYDAFHNLKLLNLNTDDWSPILSFLVRSKLPSKTKEIWNIVSRTRDTSSFKDLMDFLAERFRHLEDEELEKRTLNTTNFNPKIHLKKKFTMQTQSEVK